MKTYTGSPWQRLDPELREALAPIDRFLREVGPAFGRIAAGRAPEGSGLTLGAPRVGVLAARTSFADYLYLPGRDEAQTVNGDVIFAGSSVNFGSGTVLDLDGSVFVKDLLFQVRNSADESKILIFSLGDGTTNKILTLRSVITDDCTVTFPDATATLAGLSVAQTWTGLQTFQDANFKLVDEADATKTLVVSLGGSSAGADLTLQWSGTADRTIALPDITGTLASLSGAQTFLGAKTFSTLTVTGAFGAGLGFSTYTTIGIGADDGSVLYGLRLDDSTGFYGYLITNASGFSANRYWIMPDAGTLAAPLRMLGALGGALTSGRVPIVTTGGMLADDADLTFSVDTLTATKIVAPTSIQVGGGAVVTKLDHSTYTPTRSAEVNMDANVTPTLAQYMQVGSVVTVSGRFNANPTTTLVATSFEMTLPVASNIGAVSDCSGTAVSGAISECAEITGSVANNTAVVTWLPTDVAARDWSYSFTYRII